MGIANMVNTALRRDRLAGISLSSTNVRFTILIHQSSARPGYSRQRTPPFPLLCGVALESSPIPVKYMLKRLGVLKANEHRLPLIPASPDVEKQLDMVLADLGMV
jgi:hypothetical protein